MGAYAVVSASGGGGSGNGAILDGVNSTIKATVFSYTNSNPLAVRLTDTNGDYAAAGAGTQYTQDAALTVATTLGGMAMGRASAAVPIDVSADNDAVIPWYLRSGAQATVLTAAGVLIAAGDGAGNSPNALRTTFAVDAAAVAANGSAQDSYGICIHGTDIGNAARRILTDANGATVVIGSKTNNNAAPGATNVGALTALANASAPSWTEGNLTLLSTDLSGALRVSGGGGGTQYNQGTAGTATDALTMSGAVRKDTAAVDAGVIDGDRVVLSTDSVGRLWTGTDLKTIKGFAVSVNTAAADAGTIRVTNATDDWTGAVKLGKTFDSASVDLDTGVPALAVRADVDATLVPTDGFYTLLQVNPSGQLKVAAYGNVASGATDAGAPVKVAGKYNSTPITLTNGQRGDLQLDASGYVKVNVAAGSSSGTQYTEDIAAAADPIGTALNLIRNDTPSSSTVSADGDNIAARASSTGAQYVEVLAGTAKIGGDATNGLDVDVTRMSALVAGSALVGKVGIDQTTVGTTNAVSIAQIGATTVDSNSGTKSAGTIRVVLATDQPALTNKLLVTPDSVALPANQSVNVNQIGGAAAPIGAGTEATALRVTLPTDGTGKVNVAQSGTWTIQPGNTSNTSPWLVGHGKTLKSKTGSASATFTIVAAVTSKKIKVYSLSLMTASTSAVTVTFKDGAAGTAVATYILQAITGTNFGIAENLAVPSQLFETSAGVLLEMSFGAAVAVTYNLRYWDDDAA